MSVTTRPLSVTVAYRTPSDRALANAGHTALVLLVALGLLVLPMIADFLRTGVYNQASFGTLATAIGLAFISVLTSFLISLQRAWSTDPVAQMARTARLAAKQQPRPEQTIATIAAAVVDYERRNPPLVSPPGVPEGSGAHP